MPATNLLDSNSCRFYRLCESPWTLPRLILSPPERECICLRSPIEDSIPLGLTLRYSIVRSWPRSYPPRALIRFLLLLERSSSSSPPRPSPPRSSSSSTVSSEAPLLLAAYPLLYLPASRTKHFLIGFRPEGTSRPAVSEGPGRPAPARYRLLLLLSLIPLARTIIYFPSLVKRVPGAAFTLQALHPAALFLPGSLSSASAASSAAATAGHRMIGSPCAWS